MNAIATFARFFGTKSSRRPLRRQPRLNLELLEDRAVPTVAGDFVTLQQNLQGFLNKVDGALDTIVSVSQAKLPIIDKSLGELTGADMAINSFKDTIDDVLQDIGALQTNNLELDAQNLINQYLGAPQGIDILLDSAKVTLPRTAGDDLINIKLHLGKLLASPDFTFGLGLSSLPFSVTAQGTFSFDVGFEIPNLEFGLDKNAAFFVKEFDVQLAANANLDNPDLDAELGFLHVHVTENPENPNGNHLSATFGVHVDPTDPNTPLLSKPVLNGSADIDLMLNGAFTNVEVAAPNVDANFVLHWDFNNSQAEKTDSSFGSNLTAVFKHVRFNLGTYLTNMVGPAIQEIQKFTEPFKDFFELMGEPIPVISDIAKVIGDDDGVSLLDLAGIVGNSGVIPPEYSTLITLSKAVIEITNVINQIQSEKGADLENVFIDLGDFDLIGNQGNPNSPDYKDIREVLPAVDAGFGTNLSDISWSDLQKVAANLDLTEIKNGINDALGDELGGALGDALENMKKAASGGPNSASINLSFPIIDDPAGAIFGLLIGQDTDLVSFSADAQLDATSSLPVFNYQGFEISLIGGIKVDAHIKFAYDTYGLRHMVYDFFNPPAGGVTGETIGLNLLNGFYIDPTSHLHLGGSIGIKGGINYTLLQAHVVGELNATIDADLSPTRNSDANGDGQPDPTDLDGDGRIRPFEFHDDLFFISGSLSGELSFEIKVGADPLSWSDSVHIAGGEIASFNIGGVNPFAPDDGLALAENNQGTLTLNMGSLARRDARNLKADVNDEPINEKFIITHSDPQPGDPNFGEAVNVTAFGYTQRFAGVTSIFADGDSGHDTIEIDAAVTSGVTLYGGAGDDVLSARGSGIAYVSGGLDDDRLTGGSAQHTLFGDEGLDTLIGGTGPAEIHGGAGNDKIVGGAGANLLYGDGDNDLITGGAGLNTIHGGAGDDHLIAGPQSGDFVHGDDDNDLIEAGEGFGNLFGGSGDDQFVWYYVDADQGIDKGDGAAKMDGGGGIDQANFFGGPGMDYFSLSKAFGSPGYEAELLAPTIDASGLQSILLIRVDNINIDSGKGADEITINELTDTRIRNVSVNLTDLVEGHYGIGDKAVDHVTVNATQEADNVMLEAQNLVIQEAEHGEKQPLKGGVTAISGIAEYVVRVANVQDHLLFRARDGNDTVNVKGITGPTLVRGNGNPEPLGPDNDTFHVTALTTKDYVTELDIDVDHGVNTMHVSQPGGLADTFEFTQQRIESNLLHAVNFVATGGDFTGGVTLTTGQKADTVNVRNTLAGVKTVVETGPDDDVVNVVSATGNLKDILGTLAIDVGAGAANMLRITDATAASGNQGVTLSANTILGFSGPSDNTPITFNATGGELTLWLEGADQAGLAERFLVADPNARLRLSALNGDDEIYVAGTSKPTILEGGLGNDQFNLGFGFKQLGTIQGAIIAHGGDGVDVLNAVDIQAAPGQTYVVGTNLLNRSGAAPVWFDASLEALNLDATDFGDEIFVQAVPVANTVQIRGRLGNDRISGPNVDTTWHVLDTNKGLLGNVLFSDAESLRGGTANDRFNFADGKGVTGMVQGGGGNDALDYSAYTTPVTFDLNADKATNLGSWNGIKEFVGGTAADLAMGPNLANTWTIDGTNRGQVSMPGKGVAQFQGVENLQGGTSSDVFKFKPAGQVDGKVDGQAGPDKLDYSSLPASMPVQVNLTLKKATRVGNGLSSIENVAGGNGNDVLVGDAAINQLFGNAGRDLLIGRDGADVLNGGAGDDILIAGSTSYDTDNSGKAFAAIMKEWGSHHSYTQRRQFLVGKPNNGLNGAFKLTTQTVKLDLATDKLTGGVNQDWFWAKANEILDFAAFQGEKIGVM